MCCECNKVKMDRRKFIEVSALGVVGTGMAYASSRSSGEKTGWNPEKPMVVTGEKLRIQPVLVYDIYKKKA